MMQFDSWMLSFCDAALRSSWRKASHYACNPSFALHAVIPKAYESSFCSTGLATDLQRCALQPLGDAGYRFGLLVDGLSVR